MSETNLLGAKYALDLRDIRLSKAKRDAHEGLNLRISERGLVDISELSNLNKLSNYLQKERSDEEQRLFSSGNLNLYALNDRIRMRMLEIFTNLLDINLLSKIDQLWIEKDKEGKEIVEDLFHSLFFDTSTHPVIDEIIRFWFSYNNPAHSFYSKEFYGSDSDFQKISEQVTELIESVSSELPEIEDRVIFEFLTTPEKKHPNSIRGQIEYIYENWAKYLSKENLNFILLAKDLINEEEKFRGFGGPGPVEVYEFDGSGKASFINEEAYENFSEDKDWMPKLVLLAKNVYVWLEQLSRKYGRHIKQLSDIPDSELDLIAQRGISGLWLVGIWERSTASKEIKKRMGSDSAIASAYSIYDYVIAEDLGGEEAYEGLKSKLKSRGIRIGADMVPNHMGIHSKWMKEHPDWFISTNEKPFPAYSYDSEDLVPFDNEIELYLEDHYYDQSDAAVTFKRVDKKTGNTSYIYHGNDGTSLPWNDTAQINFLNEEAREAVIQTIIKVAKKFPIIRFDAAMVLAKQHIRRLWFPTPGEGGDIPSRSQYSMSDEEFQSAIPKEFWREVVDRVNEEAPDTLLLAEAFWLLEGYFVRTLGMHRVYNSAFMKMLQEEDNSDYRQTVKNVLEYDPEILKRFVNYLTTPDEESTIEVFGAGDKYFGIATMMATMPGLPMFGHGQFEGYFEKYGMEFSKPNRDEETNQQLVTRHESEIVPLLKKRYLFSGSENFFLYDFFTSDGIVNENIFAYSNRYEGEKVLVIYNNKYKHSSGWVKRSVAYSEKLNDKTTRLRQVDLFEGLNLKNSEGYLLFKDHVSGLEYIRSKDDLREKGLYVEVGAFKYHVFVDLKEVYDNQGIWSEIADQLKGEGTHNIQELFDEIASPQIETSVEAVVTEDAEDGTTSDVLTQLKAELAELKKENIALKGQIEAISVELEEYRDESQQITQLREQNQVLRDKVQKLQKPSQDHVDEYEQKITKLTAENNALKTRIEQLQTNSDRLETKNKDLQKKLSIVQSTSPSENVVSKLQEENKELNTQLSSEISANANLEKEVRDLTSEVAKLKRTNSTLQSQSPTDGKQSHSADNDKSIQDLENRISSLQSDKDKQRNIMQEQIEELEGRINVIEEEKADLETQLSEKSSYSPSSDTLLSSVLLETIMNRLRSASSGIKLRNLAMSLGISASVCLNHVKTMEGKGKVELKYNSTDDNNPIIIAK